MTNVKKSSQVNMPYLPDDLLLNCLARVSRLYYPILSLVSKRFRSLIASFELYQIRTLLGRTESCLYVCLSLSSSSKPHWFTLCQRLTRIPNPNPKPNSRWFTSCFRPYRIQKNCPRKEENNLCDKLLVSVPTRIFSILSWWNRAAIGSNIYTVGEFINSNGGFSSRVFFLDCRSHTWHEAPSMWFARKYPLMSVLDGKIYVVEGWRVPDSLDSMEVFDPKTQIWEHLPCPRAEILGQSSILRSLAIDGKLYLFGDKSMVYTPEENKWEVVGLEARLGWAPYYSSCVINNVMYSSKISRMLQWYDSEGRLWRDLKGLEELPGLPKNYSRVRLENYGGKIAVLWDKKLRANANGYGKKMIWCAVIAVERRNGQEIYGKIEWCNVVLTVPKSCQLYHFLAVNV